MDLDGKIVEFELDGVIRHTAMRFFAFIKKRNALTCCSRFVSEITSGSFRDLDWTSYHVDRDVATYAGQVNYPPGSC